MAASRELEEELSVYVPQLMEVGPFLYKKSLHMVFAAELTDPIDDWDDTELLDIEWFSEKDIASLKRDNALHANYELEAVRGVVTETRRLTATGSRCLSGFSRFGAAGPLGVSLFLEERR